MSRQNKKGQFTTEVKKTKDKARVSNDKEVASMAAVKAIEEMQVRFAEELKAASDNSYAQGFSRGNSQGFFNGYDACDKTVRKTSLSMGLIIGGIIAIIGGSIGYEIATQLLAK